ncbi:MAG: phosphatidate cytidylyltransferase [Deferrisomatales bacterium]
MTVSSRVKTALVAAPVFLGILFFGGPVLFGLLVAVGAAVGVREYGRIVGGPEDLLEETFLAGWAGVIALGFLAATPELPTALLAGGALLYLLAWIVGTGPAEATLGRWGRAIGGWVWVAFFLGHAVWVRRHGISPVVFVIAVVWAGDTAAYYVGSAWGSRPLAPRVSPNKSLEGAGASLVAAAALALALGALLPLPHGPWASLLLGVALNAVAQVGDLAESLLKRCGGVKDSGHLFPGHGGILDRIDGFLFALPLYAAALSLWGS